MTNSTIGTGTKAGPSFDWTAQVWTEPPAGQGPRDYRGSATLVHERLLVTCAHVCPPTGEGLPAITFPFSDDAFKLFEVAAVDIDEDYDVAIILLKTDAPVTPARIEATPDEELVTHEWVAHGYPVADRLKTPGGSRSRSTGYQSFGRIESNAGSGRVHLITSKESRPIIRGFSGTGVWSRQANAVTAVIDTCDEARNATAITIYRAARRFPNSPLKDLAELSMIGTGNGDPATWAPALPYSHQLGNSTETDRIAIISDVHGNLTALDAVLDDIESRGIKRIINLGDFVGKGPRGSEVVDRCDQVCDVNIRGNWDDFVPVWSDESAPEMIWWRDELRQDQRDWLLALPLSHDLLISGRHIRLFHASATSPHVRVHARHTDEEFEGMFKNTEMTGLGNPVPVIVGYGDIHDAFCETVAGRTLFNAGSVGNPLDAPTASFAILEGLIGEPGPGPFGIQLVRVSYDIEAEIDSASALAMPELGSYARELRTAIYRGFHDSLHGA
jgi:predicted phosphodiesterase